MSEPATPAEPAPTNRGDKPFVKPPLLCRLRMHNLVPLEARRRALPKMMRTFIVRKLEGCTRCGRVRCTRLTNALAGGGVFYSGYVDPATDPDILAAKAAAHPVATGDPLES